MRAGRAQSRGWSETTDQRRPLASLGHVALFLYGCSAPPGRESRGRRACRFRYFGVSNAVWQSLQYVLPASAMLMHMLTYMNLVFILPQLGQGISSMVFAPFCGRRTGVP